MRVFVAGASGAIGSRLVPQFIDAGHEVKRTSEQSGSNQAQAAVVPMIGTFAGSTSRVWTKYQMHPALR
jgi:nucleoside-diphosphate-sugar epimerase